MNNNTFFVNMITDGRTTVGFLDWSRSGICDFLLDFAIMDLNKPYLHVPELLFEYCKKRNITIPDFQERYLCMAYYKGIDVLRWHASKNAGDIIPEELLKSRNTLQGNSCIFLPRKKRAWGETSGYRDQLQKRNRMIRNKYANGLTVSELVDEYFLSLDSIKKIIYRKDNDKALNYSPTLESAVSYANAGLIEEWVQCYLMLSRKAAPVVNELMKDDALYFGQVSLAPHSAGRVRCQGELRSRKRRWIGVSTATCSI